MTLNAKRSAHAVVSCPFCLSLNRVRLDRVADRPKCGSCGRLLLLDRPIAAHDADLQRTIDGSTVPVVVDFYADWCGPCKIVAPILDELAGRYAGRLLFLKLDSDRNPQSTRQYDVRGLPTLLVFDRGRVVLRQVGALPARQLEAKILGVVAAGDDVGA